LARNRGDTDDMKDKANPRWQEGQWKDIRETARGEECGQDNHGDLVTFRVHPEERVSAVTLDLTSQKFLTARRMTGEQRSTLGRSPLASCAGGLDNS
jgi:hypothetical protein